MQETRSWEGAGVSTAGQTRRSKILACRAGTAVTRAPREQKGVGEGRSRTERLGESDTKANSKRQTESKSTLVPRCEGQGRV